jgi:hypothetical protein
MPDDAPLALLRQHSNPIGQQLEMFDRRRLWIIGLAVAIVWYPTLTWLLGFTPWTKLDFGLAFNSMAEHLLAGRFDVDPQAIGSEGFDVDGRTVSYFGIFCALLRIPLVLLPGFARTDVTWWSCLIAALLATWFQMRAITQVWSTPRQDLLAAALLISVILGGPHIQFLRPSIYQEPINWACAQSMAFVWLAIRGLTSAQGFNRTTLCWMAVCAGLALLTRVSFGIGGYAAFGLLLSARGQPREWPAPAAILLAFIAMTGTVNLGRWGNPLTFADYSHFDISQDVYPDRLGRLAAYGVFNPARIWLGLDYYFLPIWIWIRADGHVLFAESQATLMDAMELPPGSFFLTDPLLLGLAVAGVLSVRDRIRAALLLGLCVPPVLMLCAISMAHRYRMEFYPLLFLAALFCIRAQSRRTALTESFRAAIIGSVVVGIVAAHGMAVLDARSPRGPGEFYLERDGLIGTYTRQPQ